jgi:hypothetical protein
MSKNMQFWGISERLSVGAKRRLWDGARLCRDYRGRSEKVVEMSRCGRSKASNHI